MKRRREKHHRRSGIKQAERCFGLGILLCVLLAILSFTNGVLGPALTSMAEIQVKNMMNKSINEAIAEEFMSQEAGGKLMQVETVAEGQVTMIQADMAAVNRMTIGLTRRIQEKIGKMQEERLKIPLGSIFGSQILSQVGPFMELRVIPVGTADVGFKTEFESSGINQTRHRIYLTVHSTAKILVPFTMAKVQTENEILMAETVIVGDTPQSYVFVPEESILDGVDSSVGEE